MVWNDQIYIFLFKKKGNQLFIFSFHLSKKKVQDIKLVFFLKRNKKSSYKYIYGEAISFVVIRFEKHLIQIIFI